MMPPPKKPKWVQLNVRVASELRDDLTDAAKDSGASINVQAAKMLGRSFLEEKMFDGKVGREMAYFLADAFVRAGKAAAPDRKISQWINDPDVYVQAMFNVFEALMVRQPGITLKTCRMQIESLRGRIETKFLNRPITTQQEAVTSRKAQRAGG
jgi:hypothetical protein